MVTTFEKFLSWVALPVYVWQGLATRRKTIRMKPPELVPDVAIKGKGTPIRLLMVGDSSIAGLGVEKFEHSVAGQTPNLLAEKTGRPVTCHTNGNSSATAGSIRDFVVPNLEHAHYDYVFLSIGVNDAKNFHSGKRFCREFGTLIYALKARFPSAKLIWSGIVDIGGIPALPTPLNRILSIRSRVLRQNGEILCFEQGAFAPQSKWVPHPDNFSKDRFHCSEKGYLEWAQELSDYIAEHEKNPTKGE